MPLRVPLVTTEPCLTPVLPPELVIHIISFIDTLDDRATRSKVLKTCSLVCRDWMQLCRAHIYRHVEVDANSMPGLLSAIDVLDSTTITFPAHVLSLRIETYFPGDLHPVLGQWLAIALKFVNTTRMEITGMEFNGLAKELIWDKSHDEVPIHVLTESFPNIVHLVLERCYFADNRSEAEFLASFKRLESLQSGFRLTSYWAGDLTKLTYAPPHHKLQKLVLLIPLDYPVHFFKTPPPQLQELIIQLPLPYRSRETRAANTILAGLVQAGVTLLHLSLGRSGYEDGEGPHLDDLHLHTTLLSLHLPYMGTQTSFSYIDQLAYLPELTRLVLYIHKGVFFLDHHLMLDFQWSRLDDALDRLCSKFSKLCLVQIVGIQEHGLDEVGIAYEMKRCHERGILRFLDAPEPY